jgi:hypothetical protein
MKAQNKPNTKQLVKSPKESAMKLLKNKSVTTSDVNRIRKAVKSSAVPPKSGKFGTFIGQ